jgi:hypothetical protein
VINRLVLDLMQRRPEAGGYRPQLPAVVLSGAHGYGKTALLDALAYGLEGQVPFAKLDFGAHPDITPREVLIVLAFGLGRWCPGYGRLRFDRFLVGEFVTRLALSSTDPKKARAEVQEALEGRRGIDRLKRFTEGLAEEAAKLAPRPVRGVTGLRKAAGYVSGVALHALGLWRPTRRVVLGPSIEWYGARPNGRRVSPFDVLVTLSRDSTEESERAQELLLTAFLADLDAQFAKRHQAHRRPRYCPVLLDNIDTPAGTRFLDSLASVWQAGNGHRVGPFLMIGTRQSAAAPKLLRDAYRASHADWQRLAFDPDGFARGSNHWRYEVALPALSGTDMVRLAEASGIPCPRRVAGFLQRLTDGHPESAAELTRRLAEQYRDSGMSPRRQSALLRGVLSIAMPEPSTMTVSDFLLGRMLGDIDDELRRSLVTLSAARTIAEGLRLVATLPGSMAAVDLSPVRAWIGPDAESRRTLHPLLRRLLLARLAGEPEGGYPWTAAHRALREQCARDGDRSGAMYHCLALGEVPGVVADLRRALESAGSDSRVRRWLARFTAATAAPRRPGREESPRAAVARHLKIGNESDLVSVTLTELTVACWIGSDPVGDPAGELRPVLGDAFRRLATYFPHGYECFMEAADDAYRSGEGQ